MINIQPIGGFLYASAENILIADLATEETLLIHIVLVLLALLL